MDMDRNVAHNWSAYTTHVFNLKYIVHNFSVRRDFLFFLIYQVQSS